MKVKVSALPVNAAPAVNADFVVFDPTLAQADRVGRLPMEKAIAAIVRVVENANTAIAASGDHNGHIIRTTAATAVTYTITGDMPAGWHVGIVQDGLGVVEPVGAGGANVRAVDDAVKTPGQYGGISILRVQANEYRVIGGVE